MKISRRVLLTCSSAMVAIAVGQMMGGCSSTPSSKPSSTPSSTSQSAPVVNLYTARHYEADTQVYEGFFRKTGIKVNLIESPAEKLVERLKSEGQNSPADVVITVDAGNLVRAKEEGVLQKLDNAELNSTIDAKYRDPEGFWYGFTKRGRVIVYNKDLVKDPNLVKTYEDLADPKLKQDGRKGVLIRSSGNVYNQSLVGSILANSDEAKTETWVKGLVSNFARSPEGNDTAQLKALAAGLGEFAVTNTYYVARLQKSSKPEEKEIASKLGVIFPNQSGDGALGRGAHFNISGGGIAKNAPNKSNAIEFLKYLASPEAQAIFAGSNNEYPMVKGVPVDSVLESYGKNLKEDAVDAVSFGKNNAKALQIMDRSGWK
jgi:iron(III) transport system substrate-binding protein